MPAVAEPSMQLLAQDYAEIVAALQAEKDSKGQERRTAVRMEVQAKISISPVVGGKLGTPFTCLTRDVSFKGLGLFQAKPSPRGSQFVIRLPRHGGEPLALVCTVMYCRELADGLFNVGAAFAGPYDGGGGTTAQATGGGDGPSSKAELSRIRQSILG
jgi:hypothetical protein